MQYVRSLHQPSYIFYYTLKMPAPILVIGSANTDMVVKTATLPAPGEMVLGGEFLMNPGGKGANQAVAAARLGGAVTFVAKVGDDVFRGEAVAGFIREGIDTQYVFIDPSRPSGVALINVDAYGENCIAVAPGANCAYLHTANGGSMINTPPVSPVDTTAAGDCFNGALTVALAEEQPLTDAVMFACRAAAVSVTRMGAQASLPTRADMA